jgi:hypothetical protein
MKTQIRHRFTGAVLFECEVPDSVDSGLALRHALERAVALNTKLDGANLVGASLDGAKLDGARLVRASLVSARLVRANLVGANLVSASLEGAKLDGARLVGANLVGARLDGARLDGANLVGANLEGASLVRASLIGARLDGARLDRANLVGANLVSASLIGASLAVQKNDFWSILLRAPHEIAGLRLALVGGRVDGSAYEGVCACLVGTIANVRGKPYKELNGISPNSSRPAEQWFLGIKKGDTPETNQISALTVGWLDEFVGLLEMVKAS